LSNNLVIVESPAKASTIEKYLGKDFKVMASYGHVRDLPSKDGAVDTDGRFQLTYQLAEDKGKHVDAIARALKKSDALYLATDPDREGEAISWHLLELMKERGLLEGKAVHRVVFHEITKRAICDAVDNPRGLSLELVNAQQARRALDYLVGFNLSPLLWRKIRGGLSAGRVQSPALRMIVERDQEIDAFVPQEYWSVEADVAKADHGFRSRLILLDGDKFEQFTLTDSAHALAARDRLLAAAGGVLSVSKIDRKQRRRNPAPPFTTSTLQQEASRKLGFSAQRTMRLAQRLYEGMDVGDESVGLISYMRTDSVTLSQDALAEIRSVIASRYGADNLPDAPRKYKTKAKNAQEAHEAIRPTAAARTPDSLRGKLDEAQYKLYELIWRRTVACQMVPAVYDTVAADMDCGDDHRFRANGSILVKPGFIAVYLEGKDDNGDDDDDRKLPAMEVGDSIQLNDILAEQHFTEPPPRYSEASLVKTLEEYGIGRPSTYASIISTLTGREYVELVNKRFHPTDTGRVVNGFLTDHFEHYVDYEFTARLEDDLDAVSRGEKDWVALLSEFWTPFHELVTEKQNLSRQEVTKVRELGVDPESGRPMIVRMGRYGPFVQIGTRDDEEKPKFAGLRKGQRMDTITMEEALPLFQLPRELGETPEGEKLQVNIGRFGPYVRYGDRFASIRGDDDPYTITLERALVVVQEKKEADEKRTIRDFGVDKVRILRGRWGPYVTDGDRNARIPKDEDAEAMTFERCKELLAAAPPRRGRKKKAAKKKASKKKAAKKKSSKKSRKKASKKKAGRKKSSRKAAAAKPAAPAGD
jgi:DNA topoisomerase I